MSEKILLNLEMDADDYEAMTALCSELGMSVSTAFRIFAKKMIREDGLPFDVSLYSKCDGCALTDLFDDESDEIIDVDPDGSEK